MGTGVEGRAAMDSGDMVVSPVAGEVIEVSGDHIVIRNAAATANTRSRSASSSGPTRARA